MILTVNKICDINSSLEMCQSEQHQNENSLFYTVLFGKENMNGSENAHILNAMIEYILSTERFNILLFE